MAAPKYLRATTGFMTADGVVVKSGQTVAADDRVVKGRADLFEPLDDHIEQATRAPGERRITPGGPARDVVVMSARSIKRAQARQAKAKAEREEAERLKAEQEEAERLAAEAAAENNTGTDDGDQEQGDGGTTGTADGGSGD
ncbi:MAG: hypothetical protein HOV94_41315 [Saccharothrix sp.]|nr:hypothetical protein [Saccharothrix sp.]